jgi:hypothetical protein
LRVAESDIHQGDEPTDDDRVGFGAISGAGPRLRFRVRASPSKTDSQSDALNQPLH